MKHIVKPLLTVFFLTFPFFVLSAQEKTDANIFGDVTSNGEHLPFATIHLEGTNIGTATDRTGHYILTNLPVGEYVLVAKMVGYKNAEKKVVIRLDTSIEVNFELEEELLDLDAVVVTGTKTFKRQTESPVIVNVIEGKLFDIVETNSLADGLCFQPGLRVETDCQTCNYTQLRMNGLGGAYSQILINGRPVFSPLTGLYGLEQIPSNMIEQIEVVRGGGSSLYGSSAIGGTVNIITRIPRTNSYEFSARNSWINGGALEQNVSGSLSALSVKRNAGISLYATHRDRDAYDHNGDGFSEMPKLRNNSFGLNAFLKPTENQKLEASFSSLYEYRRGGDRINFPAHEASQAEERVHHVLMAGLDYEVSFNEDRSQFIAYTAGQLTDRTHYTGIIPDVISKPYADSSDFFHHFLNPPYGTSETTTWQLGGQLNHRLEQSLIGTNVLTLGLEYVYDDTFDEIRAYQYLIDQTTRNLGAFVQTDWAFSPSLTLLAGIRADQHNLLDNLVFNPRVSLLYRPITQLQLRLGWATGFRAPQAFDADMHIAFAGGGISRITLAPDLKEERSQSLTGSVNYDMPREKYIYGFTLEGFYTGLEDAFVLEEVGEDAYGTLFEKRNAGLSTVYGGTLEVRANYNKQYQLEGGFTYQQSRYNQPVQNSAMLEPSNRFLRTPDYYGYFTFTANPTSRISGSLTGVYTGPMLLVHYAGAPELPETDQYVQTEGYWDINTRMAYTFHLKPVDTDLELFGGIHNIFNEFQQDFDTGKNRDSGYIYGPARPRTFFIGLKIKSL